MISNHQQKEPRWAMPVDASMPGERQMVETYMHAMGDQLDFHFDQSSAMDDLAEAAE